jgi:hypothetical protein
MTVSTAEQHRDHPHVHGANCGHTAVRHEGHIDYLHDGHLHHMNGDHVEEHRFQVNAANPEECTPNLKCAHQHGPGCGHEAVPHGDHVDYLVNGHLHHPHNGHCDDHGRYGWLSLAARSSASSGGSNPSIGERRPEKRSRARKINYRPTMSVIRAITHGSLQSPSKEHVGMIDNPKVTSACRSRR